MPVYIHDIRIGQNMRQFMNDGQTVIFTFTIKGNCISPVS